MLRTLVFAAARHIARRRLLASSGEHPREVVHQSRAQLLAHRLVTSSVEAREAERLALGLIGRAHVDWLHHLHLCGAAAGRTVVARREERCVAL